MLPCGRNNAVAKGHRLPQIDSKQSAGKSYALRHGYRVHVLEQEATQHCHGDRASLVARRIPEFFRA